MRDKHFQKNYFSLFKESPRGFTIVELLIVIVVIAILAAITIVAYSGIRERAIASSLSSALSSVSTSVGVYRATNNDTFPNLLSTAGIFDTNETKYQYSLTRTGYCATATTGSVSYTNTESTNPVAGGCIGHSIGGVPLTPNLIPNPSFEANTAGWGTYVGATMTRVPGGVGTVVGTTSLEVNAGTSNQSGVAYTLPGLAGSTAYTYSVYIYPISGDFTNLVLRISDSQGTKASGVLTPLVIGQSVRKSLTWTSSATPGSTLLYIWRNGTAPANGIFQIDAAKAELGSTANLYSE